MIYKYLTILVILPLMLIPAFAQTSPDDINIPSWVKSNAGWWADGSIDDETFIQGIEFLMNQGFLQENDIPITTDYIRLETYKWASGQITDSQWIISVENWINQTPIEIQTSPIEIQTSPIEIQTSPTEDSVFVEPEPELNLHEQIDFTVFTEVITLLQHLIDIFNEVINSVNTNTSDIAELKQQIVELQELESNTPPQVSLPLTDTSHGKNNHWVRDVSENFEDEQDADSELTFSATYEHISGNPDLIQSLYFTGYTLHLETFGDSAGVYLIIVRSTDTDGLFIEDDFRVSLN